jgi:hypothetical protein
MKADASNSESGVADNEDLSDWGTIRLTFAPERGKVSFSVNSIHFFEQLWKPHDLILFYVFKLVKIPRVKLKMTKFLSMYS